MKQLNIMKQITNRKESPSLEKYLNDIAKYDLLGIDEEVNLFKELEILNPERKPPEELKNFDLETKVKIEKIIDQISKANLRFVVSVAKQYQHYQIPLQDLINVWNLWLLKAIYKFDYKKWFKLISYAVWWIRQSILQYIAENSTIKIPMNQNGRVNEALKFARNFEQIHGRKPTEEEIKWELSLSDTEFKNYQDAVNTQNIKSLDEKMNNDEVDDLQSLIENKNSKSPDFDIEQSTTKEAILHILSKSLTWKEKIVISMYFWIWQDRERSTEEIAEILDVSQQRVKQIKDKALKKLKRIMTLKRINDSLNE